MEKNSIRLLVTGSNGQLGSEIRAISSHYPLMNITFTDIDELDIADDILIVDGAVPSLIRDLRVRLSAICRDEGRRRPFKKIVSADSGREDGLQLADMVAGAIMQSTKGTDVEYYQTFADKVVDLWKVQN